MGVSSEALSLEDGAGSEGLAMSLHDPFMGQQVGRP